MPELDPVVPTPEQLRGLSHPLRLRLLGLLRMDGPQTATELARATGLNTGATSYHLRQLAQHGFIEDAPGLGVGRERHWRARHRGTLSPGPPERPERSERPSASTDDRVAWRQTLLTWTTGVLQSAQDEWAELPEPWREVSTLNDFLLRLTAEQAAAVLAKLHTVLADLAAGFPYDTDPSTNGNAGRGDGSELWQIHLLTVPAPGRIPHRDDHQ